MFRDRYRIKTETRASGLIKHFIEFRKSYQSIIFYGNPDFDQKIVRIIFFIGLLPLSLPLTLMMYFSSEEITPSEMVDRINANIEVIEAHLPKLEINTTPFRFELPYHSDKENLQKLLVAFQDSNTIIKNIKHQKKVAESLAKKVVKKEYSKSIKI